MKIDRKALNLFKTYMVLGPDYQRERGPKPIFPKSIAHEIMQYAQYEDWMETAIDLAAFLKRDEASLITNSGSWTLDESLNETKKWLANPENPRITESYDFVEKSIMPMIHFLAKCGLPRRWTVLMLAASTGHTEVLKALLALPGIDVNAMSEDGSTALKIAASNGQTEALKVLLAAPGIDVNAADNDGSTALTRAVIRGNTETLKALLAAPGIDVNATTNQGMTALMIAKTYLLTKSERLINEHLAQHELGNQNKCTIL